MRRITTQMFVFITIILAVFVGIWMIGGSQVRASGDVEINKENFPDENFRVSISESFDLNKDGVLSEAERRVQQTINVNDKDIESLKGIEYFTEITQLYCAGNQLTSLDLSKNTALNKINCCSNSLTSLDVSKNTTLKSLWCYNNLLTSLDVRGCSSLLSFLCYGNQLAKVDISNCLPVLKRYYEYGELSSTYVDGTKVYWLDPETEIIINNTVDKIVEINETYFPNWYEKVHSFDVDGDGYLSTYEINGVTSIEIEWWNSISSLKGIELFTNLTYLDISFNQGLQNLNEVNNPKLMTIKCSRTKIESLDTSIYPDLVYLDCSGCTLLESLELSSNSNLKHLNCGGYVEDENQSYPGKLNSLDVTHNTKLEYLNCSYGILSNIRLGQCTQLKTLACEDNKLTNLDVSGCNSLQELHCGRNELTNLDVSGSELLQVVDCSNNQLTSLDVIGCNSLLSLICMNNQLTNLDLRNLEMLNLLRCNGCDNLSVNVHGLDSLQIIEANHLKSLDAGDCSKLTVIKDSYDYDGNISIDEHINVEKCNSLSQLDVIGTLTTINVNGCTSLSQLRINSEKIQQIDVSSLTNLSLLDCSGCKLLKTLDLRKNASLKSLDCSETQINSINISYCKCLIKAITYGAEEITNKYQEYRYNPTSFDSYLLKCNVSTEIINEEELSVTPTPIPSAQPTISPTVRPTVGPATQTITPTTKPVKPTEVPTKAPTQAPAVSLSLDKKKMNIICGKTSTLKVTLKNSSSKVTWTSSDNKVAGVDSNGKITAKMAGSAVITATAAGKKASCNVTVLYKDVTNAKDFWYAPTNYLTAKGVVKGYDKQTLFKPANDCTRAQMLTFMWRLQGEPTPKASTCKFPDVKKTDYFYKPVIWAVEKGITTGYSDGKFKPQNVCTRAQTVTFLWRMANKPAPKTKKNPFPDVNSKDYFYKATLWASEKKILAGLPDGTFNPQGKCLRRQMVTFLYKYDKYVNGKG